MNNYWWNKLGLTSFDIETEKLEPLLDETHKGIWSLGAKSKDKASEYFIDQKRSSGEALQRLRDSSEFNAAQFEKGIFNPYKQAIESGSTHSVEDALSDIFGSMDKSGALLIQNLNFENKFVSSVMDGMDSEQSQKIKDLFRYQETLEGSNRVLFRPPEVKRHLDSASIAYNSFLAGGKEQDFATSLGHYRDMMEQYRSEATSGRKGLFVMDLMDITRATQAEAANKGFLDKSLIGTGTKVSFLSEALFGETEKHTALDDAAMQEKIFNRLMGIREELSSGNVTDETRLALARMRVAQPQDAKRMFIESIQRASDDIDKRGFTRINAREFMLRNINSTVIDVAGPEGIEKLYQPQWYRIDIAKEGIGAGVYKTSDKAKAYADVVDRFRGRNLGNFNPEEYVRGVLDGAEIIQETEDSVIESIRSKKTINVKDRAIQLAEDAKSRFNKLSKNQKIGVIGIAALGAINLLNSGDDLEDEKLNARIEASKGSTLNKQMQRFKPKKDPLIYHGTGIQNWKERKKHHQY